MDSRQFQIKKTGLAIKQNQTVTRQSSMPKQQQPQRLPSQSGNSRQQTQMVKVAVLQPSLIRQESVSHTQTLKDCESPSGVDPRRENLMLRAQMSDKDALIESLQRDKTNLSRENANFQRELTTLKDQLKRKDREIQGLKVQLERPREEKPVQQFDENEARSMMLALQLQERERRAIQAMQYYTFMQEAMAPRQQDPNEVNPDNMTYEQLLELQEKIGHVSRGLTKEQIKHIQKHKITLMNKAKLPDVCSICFSDFKTGEKYRQLGCSHPYHGKCIKQWLLNEKKCPICKVEVHVS